MHNGSPLLVLLAAVLVGIAGGIILPAVALVAFRPQPQPATAQVLPAATAAPTASPTPTPTPSPSPTASPAPVRRAPALAAPRPAAAIGPLYVETASKAAQQAAAWQASRPGDAALMQKMAARPQAVWFGGWSGDPQAAANNLLARAGGKTPVLVAYNIPQRDCGGYSAGGVGSPEAYTSWISGLARGIAGRSAIVILEPDAVAGADCLSAADRATRYGLLAQAINQLRTGATRVYLDAGVPGWLSPQEAANRLKAAGISQADGFSLNVSNYQTTATNLDYGRKVSALTGGKHFVVDTSRNGQGPAPDNAWCNPPGRGLGEPPTLATGQSLADGYLWIKVPGDSDGGCNGGPAAGVWWPDRALELARLAVF